MHKILLVTASSDLLTVLEPDYKVTLCCTAEAALELLHQEFDGLILDLFLPGTDGLTLLEQAQNHLPPVVLILTRLLTEYIMQSVETLCGGYVLRIPCTDQKILHRLEDMFRKFDTPAPESVSVSVRYHLRRLTLSPSKGLYRMMIILQNFDPKQNPCLFKDFYPELSKQDSITTEAIDNSIHRTIQLAYDHRNDSIWKEYFPDTSKCPSNKEFLTAIAERIAEKSPSR